MSARPLRVMCLSNMYPGPGAPDYGAFIERMCDAMEKRGVEVDRVVIRTRSSGRLRTPLKYAGLTARALAASQRADVIWAHYLFPTGLIAAIAGGLGRTPWVVTAHGGDVVNLSNGVVRRLSSAPAHSAAAVIAVSEWLAGRMYAEGLRPERVEIASMGVDARRFAVGDRAGARARLGLPPDAPLVVAVGGLSERKNPLGLMRAFGMLREQVPDARLALVGSGPLAGAVDAQARAMGLDDVIIRTGLVPNSAVTDWMTACDVAALVSLVEPLGVAALEAMASGRPVVGTEVGGLREVVPDGVAGVIVDPGDDAAIAAGLARMISSPPDPMMCRDAALVHSLDVETDRVLGVLATAARR